MRKAKTGYEQAGVIRSGSDRWMIATPLEGI
jgi:hypothetical protein